MGIGEGITVVPAETGGSDPWLLAVSGIYLFHGCDKVLDIVYPPACHAQRGVQHPEIAVDPHQVAHGDLFQNDHVTAVKHQDNGERVGENFKNGHIFHPNPGAPDLGFLKPVILDPEFFFFIILFCESLYHPVSADILLDKGVQRGETVPVPLEGGFYFF